MSQIVVRNRAEQPALKAARDIVAKPIVSGRPELAAGIWLYVDELELSHRLSQAMDSQTGSYWHAIMHRREGDFDNALYWIRRMGRHPVAERVPDYDPVDLVQLARANDPRAIKLQRAEWSALFEWCALNC